MERNKVDNERDRRDYFRIDDISILKHTIVDANNVLTKDEMLFQQRKKRLTLKAKLESMTREMRPIHEMIAARSEKIAQYLSMIDKKLEIISDCMVSSELIEMEIEPSEINLGAGGISFLSNSPIMAGGLVEIELVLLPENNVVFSCAKVINCNRMDRAEKDKNNYKIAVEFIDMDEEVRDLISRHVIKKELDGVADRHNDI